MTTSATPPPPSTTTTEYDAIVVGAGYAGLMAGGILSRNGLRTIVVDENNQVGGRGGATNYHGYWLNFGLRDGRDFGDVGLGMCSHQYGRQAAEAAGAEIAFVKGPPMRAHLVADRKIVDSVEGEAGAMRMAEVLGVPPEEVGNFFAVLGRLKSESPEKTFAVTFKEWLPTIDEPLRKVFQAMATTMYSIPWEETSLGRFVEFLQIGIDHYVADDPEVGNMQGFMEPYARAIRANGGTIALGLKPFEILVEHQRAAGVVVRDMSHTIQVLRAPAVVYAEPAWDVFEVLSERYLPDELVENLRKLQRYNGDAATINLGLTRLPTVRATGEPDSYAGWNRVLQGQDRRYGGGWHIPSLISHKTAPVGWHLLTAVFGTSGRGYPGIEPFESLADAQSRLDPIIDYAREYYRDLDEIIEFKTYHIIPAPTTQGATWKAIRKAPVEAPTVSGLYFVANTTEVGGTYHDIEANAALQATSLIVERSKERSASVARSAAAADAVTT